MATVTNTMPGEMFALSGLTTSTVFGVSSTYPAGPNAGGGTVLQWSKPEPSTRVVQVTRKGNIKVNGQERGAMGSDQTLLVKPGDRVVVPMPRKWTGRDFFSGGPFDAVETLGVHVPSTPDGSPVVAYIDMEHGRVAGYVAGLDDTPTYDEGRSVRHLAIFRPAPLPDGVYDRVALGEPTDPRYSYLEGTPPGRVVVHASKGHLGGGAIIYPGRSLEAIIRPGRASLIRDLLDFELIPVGEWTRVRIYHPGPRLEGITYDDPPPPGYSQETITTLLRLCPGLHEMIQHCPAGKMTDAASAVGHPICPFGTNEATAGAWHAMNVQATIIHLNDAHKWTREQIADWLDKLHEAGLDLSIRDPE